MSDSEKKIIVDEDWKAQVEAEKEAVRHPQEGDTKQAEPTDMPDGQLPPATFPFLCTTLATQAMIALGQIPNPLTGKASVRLNQAKHYIDTLAMLEEKTAGNRTDDESAMMTELLHQLRLAYVMLQNSPQSNPTIA
jgi:hypothetical protein